MASEVIPVRIGITADPSTGLEKERRARSDPKLNVYKSMRLSCISARIERTSRQ
jgi:hypothetical protein